MNNLTSSKHTKNSKAISFFFLFLLFLHEGTSFSFAYQALRKSPNLYFHLSASNLSVAANRVENNSNKSNVAELSNPGITVVNSGPGQAETSGFSLNSPDGMVNKFTGDFSYSIPLMDVEGYPIVLNYNSNVTMNSEASWVGFGWDLNLGSVARDMRGIPDEFNGNQEITRTFKEKQNTTTEGEKIGGYVGLGKYIQGKFLSLPSVQVTALLGSYKNSILGYGKTTDLSLQGKYSMFSLNDSYTVGAGLGLNLGYHRDTKHGIGISKSINISAGASTKAEGLGLGAQGSVSFGNSFNSRHGMISKSFSWEAGGGYLGEAKEDTYKGADGTVGFGSTIMYGTQTSVPRINTAVIGTSNMNTYKLYADLKCPGNFVLSLGTILTDYSVYNDLVLSDDKIHQPAFGYFHSGKRAGFVQNDTYPIMDFNRTNESAYSSEMKDLPFSIQTYDVFYANALGLSGTFRPRRTDIGTYYDPTALTIINEKEPIEKISDLDEIFDTDINELSAGITVGAGVKLHLGLTVGYQPSKGESGVLQVGAGNVLEFNPQASSANFDDAVYFKSVGECTPEDLGMYSYLNGGTPDYFKLQKADENIQLTNQLAKKGIAVSSAVVNSQNDQPVAATVFLPKTVADLANDNTFFSHSPVVNGQSSSSFPISRTNGRSSNHISAVEIVSTDGTKYNYGIPVFNLLTDEVSFASSNLATVSGDPSLIIYSPGVDNSVGNTRGWTNYYDKTEVPAYAHSFLLTEMKSSDYVDRTKDGLSTDDIGSFYKFNYSRVYGNSGNEYKWRYPIGKGNVPVAIQSRGLLATTRDDMAHYTYGTKEIWYAHSVESKNFIAEFILDNREDGFGVSGENGTLDTSKPLKLLKKIVLYNRADKLANPSTAIPLQTVEFEYDYSRCLGHPTNKNTNSSSDYNKSGKLTLTMIRTYSGNSKEMGLSTTTFEYEDVNPPFNYSDVDGWGNYKKNDPLRSNDLFPFAEQDETKANNNSTAYKLKAINNPQGGRIEISYEADRYAFVQNKRVMRYMDIEGMTNIFNLLKITNNNSWDGSTTNDFTTSYSYSDILSYLNTSNTANLIQSLFSVGGGINYAQKFGAMDKSYIPNNVIVFKLEEPLASSFTKQEAIQKVKEQYFKDPSSGPNAFLKELYFRLQINANSTNSLQEIIPCAATISEDINNVFGNVPGLLFNDDLQSIGVMPKIGTNSQYQYGYVVLNPVNSGNIEANGKDGVDNGGLLLHPLQRAALDFMRFNLPDILYGSCDNCTPDLSIDNAVVAGRDMYKFMLEKGMYAPSIRTYSAMRLFEQDNIKFGGNARVETIKYKDNWSTISGEYSSEYQWNYYYEDHSNNTFGVAAYESRAILEENPFYHWESFVEFHKKFPDESKFKTTPIADALYPTPIIGYSEVTVKFIGGISNGFATSKFYTAKDYPTIEKSTMIDKSSRSFSKSLLFGKTVDMFGFAQGYAVETNDFHGKPKETTVYNQLNQKQSRTTYTYYQLDDPIKMMERNATTAMEHVALEYDIHADSRFISDETKLTNVGLKLTWTLPSFIPVPSPVFFKTSRKTGYFSTALIKHINRSAIVKSIETEYLGSINNADNHIYDKYTGNVLVSSLKDEFGDRLFSINYPSHWYYSNLSDISSVSKSSVSGSISNGTFSATNMNLSTLFTSGDVLSVNVSGNISEVIVLQILQNELQLVNLNGTKFTGSGSCIVTIKKSNRKNRLNETMQNIVTKKSPFNADESVFSFPSSDIISSSALSYKTRNNVRCGTPGWNDAEGRAHLNHEVEIHSIVNPFELGVKGDLVLDRQFAWQDGRSSTSPEGIRQNGIYSSNFLPFYSYNGTASVPGWYRVNEPNHPQYQTSQIDHYQNWRDLGHIVTYNEYGAPLESKDQIGIFSSVLYGYNSALNLVPVAQAVNASQQDIAFDGFEDYDYYSSFQMENDETHFDFKSSLTPDEVELVQNVRHSGITSLKIAPLKNAEIVKNTEYINWVTPIPAEHHPPGKSDLCLYQEQEGIINGEFTVDECLCIQPFKPHAGEYVISVWVKEDYNLEKVTYENPILNVNVDGFDNYSFEAKGNIIDGWQRIEGTFVIPNALSTVTVQLSNISTSTNVYFDDLRIHPFLAGMTTVVYDPKTLLPMATHDGYNFTTFFNYDENLNQVRIRVETEKGIQTISESEFGGQKK